MVSTATVWDTAPSELTHPSSKREGGSHNVQGENPHAASQEDIAVAQERGKTTQQ